MGLVAWTVQGGRYSMTIAARIKTGIWCVLPRQKGIPSQPCHSNQFDFSIIHNEPTFTSHYDQWILTARG